MLCVGAVCLCVWPAQRSWMSVLALVAAGSGAPWVVGRTPCVGAPGLGRGGATCDRSGVAVRLGVHVCASGPPLGIDHHYEWWSVSYYIYT